MRRDHTFLGKVKIGGTVVYRRLYPKRISLRIRDQGAAIALNVKGPEAAKYATVTQFGAQVVVSDVDVKDSQGSDRFVHPYVFISTPTTHIREDNQNLVSAYNLWAKVSLWWTISSTCPRMGKGSTSWSCSRASARWSRTRRRVGE